MRPSSGRCAPLKTFMRVLLPAPFSPINASTSPALASNSTPRNACVAPNRLWTPSIFKTIGSVVMGQCSELELWDRWMQRKRSLKLKLLGVKQLFHGRFVHVFLRSHLFAGGNSLFYFRAVQVRGHCFYRLIAHVHRVLQH